MNKQPRSFAAESGFTLIELLVASVVLAFIVIISHQSIYTATRTGELAQLRSQNLRQLDRVWVLLEADARNAIAQQQLSSFSQLIPALRIERGDQYPLMLLRGGHANPLLLPRTEVIRVGYRFEEEKVWRDTWINSHNLDEELSRPQLLIDGVEEFSFRALPKAPRGRSVNEGPWFETWPEQAGADELPLLVEVTLKLKNAEPITRYLSFLSGS